MGTWKLNEAKSKLAAGMPKNSTIDLEAAGDSVKGTIDGTDSAGKPAHNEWTGKLDGKDYPVTAIRMQMRDRTSRLMITRWSSQSRNAKRLLSPAELWCRRMGKTRTATASGTDP